MPRLENVISSHVVYKIKPEEDGWHLMKAPIVPHGNRDVQKNNKRNDSSTAQFDVIRLLLSISSISNFRMALADVKCAYLQIGPILRQIFVIQPRELEHKRGILLELTKLPYGIPEAGSHWTKTIEAIRKVIINENLRFNGCEVSQAVNGDMTMSMKAYTQ